MGRHRFMKQTRSRPRHSKSAQQLNVFELQIEQARIRESVLQTFKNHLKSPGGGPAIIVSESNSLSLESNRNTQATQITIGEHSGATCIDGTDLQYARKRPQKKEQAAVTTRKRKMKHRCKEHRHRKTASSNPCHATTSINKLLRPEETADRSVSVFGQSRLTRRLGIFNNGKKSEKIIRLSTNMENEMKNDLKHILDSENAAFDNDIPVPKNYSNVTSSDSNDEINNTVSSFTDDLPVELPFQDIATDLCTFLKPMDIFHGRNLFAELREELNSIMKQNLMPETPRCPPPVGFGGKSSASVKRALFCGENTPIHAATSGRQTQQLHKNSTSSGLSNATFGSHGITCNLRVHKTSAKSPQVQHAVDLHYEQVFTAAGKSRDLPRPVSYPKVNSQVCRSSFQSLEPSTSTAVSETMARQHKHPGIYPGIINTDRSSCKAVYGHSIYGDNPSFLEGQMMQKCKTLTKSTREQILDSRHVYVKQPLECIAQLPRGVPPSSTYYNDPGMNCSNKLPPHGNHLQNVEAFPGWPLHPSEVYPPVYTSTGKEHSGMNPCRDGKAPNYHSHGKMVFLSRDNIGDNFPPTDSYPEFKYMPIPNSPRGGNPAVYPTLNDGYHRKHAGEHPSTYNTHRDILDSIALPTRFNPVFDCHRHCDGSRRYGKCSCSMDQTKMVTASPDSNGSPAWKLVNIRSPSISKPPRHTPSPPQLCARRMY